MKTYDAIVIGSGQGGTPLATSLAKALRKTALIESEHIGGCCINEGCTPTKTLIASGKAAYTARDLAKYGVNIDSNINVDMVKVRQRKRDIVESFRGGSEKRLKELGGLDVLIGKATFTGSNELKVQLKDGSEEVCKAEQIFINVGERPAAPQVEGIEAVLAKVPDRVLNSTTIQELGKVPETLIVVGGGYVGLELGQLFMRLGSTVHVVQRSSQLLPREDPEVAEHLREVLVNEGMRIYLSNSATHISTSPIHPITLSVSSNGITQDVHGTHILFATGRVPNTDDLNPSATGLTPDARGHIPVNDKLETSVPGIYALGDVKGGPAFTHISYDDYRIIRDNLNINPPPPQLVASPNDQPTKSHTTETRRDVTPYVVYTDPQFGHVGRHLHSFTPSERAQRKLQVASMPMSYVARALESDDTRGMMKAVVDSASGEILGFSCLAAEGGEIMSIVQMAMMGGLKYWDLREMVLAHPSFAESLNNLWGYLRDVGDEGGRLLELPKTNSKCGKAQD